MTCFNNNFIQILIALNSIYFIILFIIILSKFNTISKIFCRQPIIPSTRNHYPLKFIFDQFDNSQNIENIINSKFINKSINEIMTHNRIKNIFAFFCILFFILIVVTNILLNTTSCNNIIYINAFVSFISLLFSILIFKVFIEESKNYLTYTSLVSYMKMIFIKMYEGNLIYNKHTKTLTNIQLEEYYVLIKYFKQLQNMCNDDFWKNPIDNISLDKQYKIIEQNMNSSINKMYY
jgi:hypothetical protein